MPSAIHGQFLWTELLTRDVAGAKKFYPKVVPWTPFDADMGGQPYTLWMAGEAPAGGVMTLTDEMGGPDTPPHWMGYIGTDDADATFAAAGKAGGKGLMPPFDVPTVGRLAIIADPSGAVFGILKPESDQPPAFPAPLGYTSWCELTSKDVGAALKFYHTLFGWTKSGEFDMGAPVGMYTLFNAGDNNIGGMMHATDEGGPPSWLYYTRVESAAKALDAVKANGGQVLHGPMEVPGGDTVGVCMDVSGAAFAVHQKA